MGVFENVRATIDVNINANGEQRITGKVLNGVLQEIVSASESSSSDLQESVSSLSEKVDNIGSKDFNPSGTYPDLTAGDLAGRGESVPASFGFRASGGKSIKDGRAYIKRIKGNSVVWNQKVEKTYIDRDKVLENIDVIPQNHKFALIRSKAFGGCYYMPSIDVYDYVLNDGEYAKIFVQSHVVDAEYSRIYSTGESGYIQLIDLTQLFQAGNEPTTIEEFNARVATLGIDPYAYNEGEVIHCNTESIKSVGDNAVSFGGEILIASTSNQDEVKDYQVGYTYVGIASSGYANADRVSKCEVYDGKVIVDATSGYGVGSFLEVLPNAEYHINASIEGKGNIYIAWYDAEKRWIRQGWFQNDISPYNARYAMCCLIPEDTVVFSDIMLTLVHSGWKQDTDAGYQPYWQDTLPLPIIRKYFPDGMKKAGSAHDEIRFNKATQKWEMVQRIGEVDMGTLKWGLFQGNFYSSFGAASDIKINSILLCSAYNGISPKGLEYSGEDKAIWSQINASDKTIVVRDTTYTDVETFKAMLQEKQMKLYYELAEPIVTELDAEDQNFRDYYNVADFGTEQSQSSVPSAAFSADIIYQFNAVDMIREHEAEINELQSIIATMQAQLTSLTSPTNL